MRLSLLVAVQLVSAAWALSASAQQDPFREIERLHGDAAGFEEVFGLIQNAFTYGDPVTIANTAFYPLTVQANGEAYDLQAPQDLIDNFTDLVTTETQNAVANQDVRDLIITSEGVGFGDGVLWMENVCLDDACSSTKWAISSIVN